MYRCIVTVLAVLLASLVAPAPATALGGGAGATIVGQHWLTSRTLQLDIATDAFPAPVPVEVTFPVGYGEQVARRWPVTYYLAGTNHNQTTFRVDYHGETITQDYASIVVSPNGASGYWSDWFNDGKGGQPRYETFVTRQLIPLIDATFRTIPTRTKRAVMGDSMGGFGTLLLASRHPDLFVGAASLSGGGDVTLPQVQTVVTVSPALMGATPGAIFGPFATQEVVWRGHNPVDLAENLRSVDLQIFTGNGLFDLARGEALPETAGCALEIGVIAPASLAMHERLVALGIRHSWVPLEWGCHSVALFDHEMSLAIARFATVFADPPRRARKFDYRSIQPSFDVWKWSVQADPRRAAEFLRLTRAGRRGFTLEGSGLTTITTAPYFKKRKKVRVTIDGQSIRLKPSKAGRLRFTVDLGPANKQQQFTSGADTQVRKAVVRFRKR